MENNYIQEIKDIIVKAINDNTIDLNEELRHYHEKDIADAYLELDKSQQDFLRNHLDDQFISDIFAYFAEDNIEIIEELPQEEIADIIELMDADDAKDVLDELNDENRDAIIDLMEGEIKEDIKMIDSFDEDEIGSLMTTNYITITPSLTIKQAMKQVVDMAEDNDNITTIIAVDKDNKYIGTVDLKDLIRARANSDLNDIIRLSTPFIFAKEKISDSLEKIRDYNLDLIPVLNDNKEVLGVITSADIIEVVDDELGEDYAKLAGLSSEDDLDEPLFSSVKKRIPWLIILLILALLVSVLISRFEKVVSIMTAIMFFQSLILGMSGNVGTQSLAVTIRVLNDDIDGKTIRKLLFKEMRIGVTNGLLLSAISFGFVLGFLCISRQPVIVNTVFNLSDALKASATVSIALLCSITLASFFGAFVPIILRKFKIDPAVASGPFITTINDCVAVICYYGLAFLMFYNLFV